MKGRDGTEPADLDPECAEVHVRHGRFQGRRQLAAVDGEPDHMRPSGWEPSSVQGSGVRVARAALLALAPLSPASQGDRSAVDRAAHRVDGLTDRDLYDTIAHLPALYWAEYDLDLLDAARDHLDRALAVASRVRFRTLLPGLFVARAVVAARQGRLGDAIRDAQESAARARRLGLAAEHAFAVTVALPARLWRHGPAAARGPLAAVPPPHTLPVSWWRPIAAVSCAEVLLHLGQGRAARTVTSAALDQVGDQAGAQQPTLLALAATAELACGRHAAAAALGHRAMGAAAGGSDLQQGVAGLAQARLLLAAGAHRPAMAAATAAAVRLESAGAQVDVGRARLVAARAAAGPPRTDPAGAWTAARERRLAGAAFAAAGAHWLTSTMDHLDGAGAAPSAAPPSGAADPVVGAVASGVPPDATGHGPGATRLARM